MLLCIVLSVVVVMVTLLSIRTLELLPRCRCFECLLVQYANNVGMPLFHLFLLLHYRYTPELAEFVRYIILLLLACNNIVIIIE